MMSLGIWYEAIMRWIGEATQIAVMGKTFVKQRLDTEKGIMRTVRIPEHIVVMAEMACGAQMTITVSSIMGENPTRQITLFGSQGTLRFDDGKLYGRKREGDELQEISIPTEESGGWRVEEEFVSSIRGTEIVTHTTFDDGLKYMEFTEAVARSMSEKRMVTLPLVPYY